ncbi:MAG: PAS domain S-box protein [Kofleriaceae bacterium]
MSVDEKRDPFSVLFYGNAAAMVISRPDTLELVDVNPRWTEMFGYTRTEAIGHTPTSLGLISDIDARHRIERHRTSSDGFEAEIRLRSRDGREIIVLAGAKPITFNGEECLITTLIDITAREHAERAFDVAFQASPAGMMLVDTSDDFCVAVNARMLELTGQPVEYFTTKSSAQIDLIVSPRRDDLLAEITRTGRLHNMETCIRSARGLSWCLLSTNIIQLHDKTYRLTVFTDIDDRKHYERRLRELNLELEARVERRTQELSILNRDLEAFTSSVSHDLRAPLRTMHGFSQILLEDFADQLPDEAKDLLTSIHSGGERLKNLIDSLLAFSRLGRASVSRTAVDFDAMVREVASELGTTPITIQPLGTAHADPQLIRAVWTNLLDNALKYSRDRPIIRITVGREERDGETFYFIEDNGVGFDPKYTDRLFTMFQRLHSSTEFEGTGVGLANVRRIVERHRGRITAHSELGRGSRFEFTLGREER